MEKSENVGKKLDKLIEINTVIRDLLILIAYQNNAPLKNLAKTAVIRKSKLYEIIPKGKKKSIKIRKRIMIRSKLIDESE